MTGAKKRVAAFLTILFLCFGLLFPSLPVSAAAEIKFDQTNVLDDLRSSDDFDILDYPFDSSGASRSPEICNVVEYCYSYRANQRDNYGLYLYLYNPQQLDIVTDSKANKVQLAVGYREDGMPNAYEKFNLQFCSMSTESRYYGLFYKFKVVDHESADGKTLAERVNSNARRYDISGIELHTKGQTNAVEYGVGGTYIFTGYAKGYGPDIEAESDLTCEVEDLETVRLDVRHTFYRTESSSKGANYKNQLDTVYFAVPKRLLDKYGRLQRIKAEWYEYKTKEILVTSNSDFYHAALPYLGELSEPFYTGNVQTGCVYNEEIGYSLGMRLMEDSGGFRSAGWGWNLGSGYLTADVCDALRLLFLVDDIEEYDPLADKTAGEVESNALYDKILSYDKSYHDGTLPIKDGTISADLFESDIDDYRKADTEQGKIQQGYSYYDFDADVDLQELTAWQDGNPSFWENWLQFGFWDSLIGNIPSETGKTLPPIEILEADDLSGTPVEVADRLFVNRDDVEALKAYYNDAMTVNPLDPDDEEKVVVLFRFATSDYYSAPVSIVELGKGFLGSDKTTNGQAYMAWESVFFDFDVIDLTFNREGKYTVIPAVSSPIDMINGLTPPNDLGNDCNHKLIVGVLLLLLLVIILAPLLPYLVRAVIWVISLPFKAIAAIVKAIQKNKKE